MKNRTVFLVILFPFIFVVFYYMPANSYGLNLNGRPMLSGKWRITSTTTMNMAGRNFSTPPVTVYPCYNNLSHYTAPTIPYKSKMQCKTIYNRFNGNTLHLKESCYNPSLGSRIVTTMIAHYTNNNTAFQETMHLKTIANGHTNSTIIHINGQKIGSCSNSGK